MKDPNEIVAVKCEGCFTEWYSPFYKEPFEDNAEYRKYYEEKILEVQPVIGPSLGDSDNEFISGSLDFLSDRITSGAAFWDVAKADFEKAVEVAMQSGDVQVVDFRYTDPNVTDIKITPYRRKDMPKPNEEHLKVYGEYADLIRERVAAI